MLTIAADIAKKGATKRQESRSTFVDLIRLPSLRLKTVCCCISWFIMGSSFYGSAQYFGQTSANVFLSFILMGVIQLSTILLSAYLSKLYGRRWIISGCFIISSIGNGFLALPDVWVYVRMIAGTVGVGSGGAVFSLMYVYTTELFPIVARNMGMGAASTANRVGSMITPFIGGLTTAWLPPMVFALAPALAVLAIFHLPETRGKMLEDHLED